MRRKDALLLARAETLPVDAVEMCDWLIERQEDDDILLGGEFSVEKYIRDAAYLDIHRILAREFKDNLTLVDYMRMLQEKAIREQLSTILDDVQRDDCVIEVFTDIADEALSATLVFDPRFENVDPLSKKYQRLIQRYDLMLLQKHKLVPQA